MEIIECVQGSEEWFNEKASKPGASSFSKIVTTKGEPSKQQTDYMYQLAGEAITGKMEEGYTSHAMQLGKEREAEARLLFEMLQDTEVRQVGLCYKDESRTVLCSPDGLMKNEGLELKNPLLKTHVKYLLAGVLPTEYFCQVQGSMYVTGFKNWWFMSYFPGIAPLVLKIPRDDVFCSKLEAELDSFCLRLAVTIRKLREME